MKHLLKLTIIVSTATFEMQGREQSLIVERLTSKGVKVNK